MEIENKNYNHESEDWKIKGRMKNTGHEEVTIFTVLFWW